MAEIHQITYQTGDKNGHPPLTIGTSCGETRARRHGNDPLPDGLTVWPSRVTCGACRARGAGSVTTKGG